MDLQDAAEPPMESTVQTIPFYANSMALGPGNPNTLYFGSDRLYRSSDRGITMTAVSQAPISGNNSCFEHCHRQTDDNVRLRGCLTGLYINIHRIFHFNRNHPGRCPMLIDRLMLSFFMGRWLLLSPAVISGKQPTWMQPQPGLSGTGIPDVPVNCLAIDPTVTNIMFAGTDIGVYVSTDAGATWSSYSSGLPVVPVFDVAVHPVTKALKIATHGRGFWQNHQPSSASNHEWFCNGKTKRQVLLEWTTATEVNNKGFFRKGFEEHG